MDIIKIEKIDEGSSIDSSNSSYFQTSNNDLKKKKTITPVQEELCLVCGDRASGFHYNA